MNHPNDKDKALHSKGKSDIRSKASNHREKKQKPDIRLKLDSWVKNEFNLHHAPSKATISPTLMNKNKYLRACSVAIIILNGHFKLWPLPHGNGQFTEWPFAFTEHSFPTNNRATEIMLPTPIG